MIVFIKGIIGHNFLTTLITTVIGRHLGNYKIAVGQDVVSTYVR